MEWLNEPASWQRTGDVLTVSVDPGTDFWRETGYGYIRDSGHVYGEVLAGDLDVSVRLRCTLGAQYDQAGVMLRADERTWLKTGVEFFEGRARLSTVLTHGRSSWMVTDLPAGTDEIVLRVSRRGDAVEVRYVIEDGPAELAALVFMPPDREVLAGVMAAAPEGPGFRVTFHDLHITERDWSGAAGEGPAAWPDDQPGWAGAEAPAWAPADGEPGWPEPGAAGEGTPDWPATAGEEPPAWPVPAAGEDPGWPADAAGDEEPEWPAPRAADDDAAWPATAGGEQDPGWLASGDDDAAWVASLAADQDDEPGWAAAPAAAEAGGQERAGVDEAAATDSPEPAGTQPARAEPAGAEPAGAEPAGAEPAGAEPASGPIAAAIAGPEPVRPEPGDPEPAGGEPAGRDTAPAGETPGDEAPAKEPAAEEAADQNGSSDHWSPAPLTGDWTAAPAGDAPSEVDPAADWEQLAAGAQAAAQARAAGAQAVRWRAQADTDVANEWPGPPLRTAMRNGLVGDAGVGLSREQSVDDAQTDPGLPRPRPATGEPSRAEPGPPAPPQANEAGQAGEHGQAEPDQPEPTLSAREARRARSRRAAADLPAEPDAADEWISLLTADPVDE
jgi:uncharacterized protein